MEQTSSSEEEIDLERARDLRDKKLRGQSLSEEETGFVERANTQREYLQALLRKRWRGETLSPEEARFLSLQEEARKRRLEAYGKDNPPRDSTGLIPITDLGRRTHKDRERGLYPGGANLAPVSHLNAGMDLASKVWPLDAAGNPSPEGKMALMSVGMSNTTQEFQAFKRLAGEEKVLNPALVLFDGAQSTMTAEYTADPGNRFWQVMDERLTEAGLTADQVQVAWFKTTLRSAEIPPSPSGGPTAPHGWPGAPTFGPTASDRAAMALATWGVTARTRRNRGGRKSAVNSCSSSRPIQPLFPGS